MPILLLFVVLVEGFTTLAMQMVALRHAIPLVGSSIILTSVVIGVILLALAVGYRSGGKLTSRLSDKQITNVLAWFLLGAGLYYVLLVFPFQQTMLVDLVQKFPYTWALFLFSLLFFFIPVAAASHTMPMITQLTQGTKGFAAGKILFVSTIGSFLGSILTSTVLFAHRGVTLTWYATALMLIACHMMLIIYQKRIPWIGIWAAVFIWVLFRNKPSAGATELFSFDSPYQQIKVISNKYGSKEIRTMLLNGGFASSIDPKTGKSPFGYIRAAVDVTDMRIALSSSLEKKKILVIGAAGFTFPEEMAEKQYTERIDTLDVDASVKEIAEEYFLQRKLNPKVNFIVQSARGFMHDALQQKNRYDIILVDAYNGTSIPEELVTKEFFTDLNKLSEYVMLNMIVDVKLETAFSQSVMASLVEARPEGVWYKNVSEADARLGNFLVATRPFSGAVKYVKLDTAKPYTDDKHSVEIDKADMFYQR